jgi:hypothetical protein
LCSSSCDSSGACMPLRFLWRGQSTAMGAASQVAVPGGVCGGTEAARSLVGLQPQLSVDWTAVRRDYTSHFQQADCESLCFVHELPEEALYVPLASIWQNLLSQSEAVRRHAWARAWRCPRAPASVSFHVAGPQARERAADVRSHPVRLIPCLTCLTAPHRSAHDSLCYFAIPWLASCPSWRKPKTDGGPCNRARSTD